MSEYSNSATVQLIGLGGRFVRWVNGCIDALVGDIAGGAAAGGRGALLIVDAAATRIADRARGGERKSIGVLQNIGGVPAVSELKKLASQTRGETTLRIGAGKAVVARIGLPSAARDVLPAVIRNKVESLAPWPLAEALWGHSVVEAPANGQIAVDVGIVSRRTLDALLAVLAEAGLKVSQLEIAGPSPEGDEVVIPVDFLAEDRNRRARRKLWAVVGAAGLAAAAVAAFGLYSAFTANEDLASLQSRIDTLQQALTGKRGGNGNAKVTAANELFDRKRDARPFVVLLNDLTRLVPDGTWLTALNFDGTRLTLTGHGSDSPKLVETLEKSDTFSDANFAAATQRDPEGTGETFSISAALRARQVAQ